MTGNDKLTKVKIALLSMVRHPWEQGTAANAFKESGDEDIVILMANDAIARQLEDGRLSAMWPTYNITDPCVCGESVMFAYEKTGDLKYLDAAKKMLDFINKAPGTEEGLQYHNYKQPMIASDCMYMVPPFYAIMREYQEAVKQADLRIKLLWNEEKQVMNHQWDAEKNTLWRDKRWGAASGWTLAALVKIIHWLPENLHRERELLCSHFNRLVNGMLQYQLPNGLFHDCLDEPDTFVETNAAQMLAYSIYRGVYWGFLDNSFISSADRIRKTANEQVDDIGLVQGAAAAPGFESPGVSPEAQSFYILMETAATDIESRTH